MIVVCYAVKNIFGRDTDLRVEATLNMDNLKTALRQFKKDKDCVVHVGRYTLFWCDFANEIVQVNTNISLHDVQKTQMSWTKARKFITDYVKD